MVLFVRLTLLLAAGLAILLVLAFILKLLVAAALLAALFVSGLFLYNLAGGLRRRAGSPVPHPTARQAAVEPDRS